MTRTALDAAPATTTTAEVPGVMHFDGRLAKFHRRSVLAITVIPFAAFITAVVTLWGHGLSGVDAITMLVLYLWTGLGVTIGYHRLLTHQSFDAPRWLRYTLATAGSMAVQGSVIAWVADHRRHHAYADKPGDPHSPHLEEEEGLRGIAKGLFHAHMGWLFKPEQSAPERWCPDLLKDPGMVRINRFFPLLATLSFVIPAMVGLVVTGTLTGALTTLLWAGLVRVFFLHHVTWSVNSICHYYGNRPFDTTDESTNNWMLSLISFGESWHNTHHAFPSSAVHGIGKWQIDVSGLIIRGLERIGVVRSVKTVSSRQLDKRAGHSQAA